MRTLHPSVRLLAWILAATPVPSTAQSWSLSLHVLPEHEGLSLPLELSLPEGLALPEGSAFQLSGVKEVIRRKVHLAVQPCPSRGTLLVTLPPCVAGTHRLALGRADEPVDSPFTFREDGAGRLVLFEGERPVLAYAYGRQGKAGVPADREREGYVHPIHDLDGVVLTDDFPSDHLHHRGLSWMWPRVRTEDGRVVDLWTLEGVAPRFGRFAAREVGPAAAVLIAEGAWMRGSVPIVEERITLRVAPSSTVGRILDVDLELRAVGGRVTLLGEPTKGYGGLGLRVAPRRAASLVTRLGREPGDRLHVAFPWADYSGAFGTGEEVSGLALFVHPSNAGAPPAWMLRYYGYFGECWPGPGFAELEPERWLRRSYRVFVHRGRAEDARVGAHWEAYANPPRTTWIAGSR